MQGASCEQPANWCYNNCNGEESYGAVQAEPFVCWLARMASTQLLSWLVILDAGRRARQVPPPILSLQAAVLQHGLLSKQGVPN